MLEASANEEIGNRKGKGREARKQEAQGGRNSEEGLPKAGRTKARDRRSGEHGLIAQVVRAHA